MSTLLSAFSPKSTLFLRTQDGVAQSWQAARCAGAIEVLAAALPAARFVIQRCEDTLDLALSTLAAWRRGQTVVMPSTRLMADVDSLSLRFPDSYVLDRARLSTVLGGGAEAQQANDPIATLLDVAPARWPAFEMEPFLEAVVLFTSGTTRAPRAHIKTWDMLRRGADTFRTAFPVEGASPVLAGTVDCHHMFGLEANLMAALHCGYPLCTQRLQLPGDLSEMLQDDMRRDLGPLWLATTPLQLSAYHRALGNAVRGIQRVIVATMPLDPGLAAQVERDWATEVNEIFGNTECGVMATRRPSMQQYFLPAPGVVFKFLESGTAVVARGTDAPTRLDDAIAATPGAQGGFVLLGRSGDMIKVAGKRTTLAALDDHLRRVPGVLDGAFVAGDGGRVAAGVVAPASSVGELQAALAARIDSAFLPRPLVMFDALPRDALGKLSRPELAQMIAQQGAPGPTRSIAPPNAPRWIEETRLFAGNDPMFDGHFPGNPVVPGAVLLGLLEELLHSRGYHAAVCESAKFLLPVLPDEPFMLHIEGLDSAHSTFEIRSGDRVHARGSFRCVATQPVA